jgi:hypothetical protein
MLTRGLNMTPRRPKINQDGARWALRRALRELYLIFGSLFEVARNATFLADFDVLDGVMCHLVPIYDRL